jgi:hypothetical protein
VNASTAATPALAEKPHKGNVKLQILGDTP